MPGPEDRLGFRYPFKTEPYNHQLVALAHGWELPEYAYFMEMGTGKTKVTIDNIALLYDAGKIDSAFILAPKGVYRNWSEREIPTHMPEHIPLTIAHWSASANKAEREAMNKAFMPFEGLTIFVMNIEAMATKRGNNAAEKFLIGRKSMIVVDESTVIKTPSALRTRATVRIGKYGKYRRILTGSPVTKSPLDLYSQCAFLNEDLLGFSSYYSFRNRFAVLQKMNYGGRTVQQVVAYRNTDELAALIKNFSFRVTKDECLDLPEKVFIKRYVEMTKEQLKAYNDMKTMAIAFLKEGDVTVTSVITQLLRLHQITCGHVTTDDGELVELPSNRLPELVDVLEEVDGKAIIWANYRHDIRIIHERLREIYGPESVVTYYGETTPEEREQAVKRFQDPDDPCRWFLGNTQTGGYGITLTQAGTVIYYSNNYDLEKRLQSEDRAHRIGQEKHVTYIDLVAKDTVDEKIIEALRKKINIARQVTGDTWKDWI